MEQNIITFSGDNSNLFTRHVIDNLSAKLTLIVPETHNAILLKDGQMLQTLSSGRYLISQFVDIKLEADSSLEILFMSKTAKLSLLWGTASKILMYDNQLQENYHLGLCGDFDVQIGDPRKCYLYLIGASKDLNAEVLRERLTTTVIAVVESVLIEYVEQNKVLFSQLSVCKKEIATKALAQLNKKLMSEYGVAVFSFNIANIIIDEKDMERLTAVYKQAKQSGSVACRGCGSPLKENDKFCSECGRKVEISHKCPQCFTENPDEAKFCSACGCKMINEEV